MSGITLTDAQAILDVLVEAQKCEGAGYIGSFTVGGHSVSFKSGAELIDQINYWSRIVASLQRRAAGQSRHGYFVPNFSGRS